MNRRINDQAVWVMGHKLMAQFSHMSSTLCTATAARHRHSSCLAGLGGADGSCRPVGSRNSGAGVGMRYGGPAVCAYSRSTAAVLVLSVRKRLVVG